MNNQQENLINNWETELRSGAIQPLVCAVISEKDLHGMAICESIDHGEAFQKNNQYNYPGFVYINHAYCIQFFRI